MHIFTLNISQDFIWGCTFLAKKVVVALKDHLHIPPNLSHPEKTVLKICNKLAGGALRVLGGALTHFPCKLGQGVQVHPLHPLATPMKHFTLFGK